jgi:hypothetical protein
MEVALRKTQLEKGSASQMEDFVTWPRSAEFLESMAWQTLVANRKSLTSLLSSQLQTMKECYTSTRDSAANASSQCYTTCLHSNVSIHKYCQPT